MPDRTDKKRELLAADLQRYYVVRRIAVASQIAIGGSQEVRAALARIVRREIRFSGNVGLDTLKRNSAFCGAELTEW